MTTIQNTERVEDASLSAVAQIVACLTATEADKSPKEIVSMLMLAAMRLNTEDGEEIALACADGAAEKRAEILKAAGMAA